MTRRLLGLGAVGVSLLTPSVARADDPVTASNAAQFFRAGLAAYDRHEFTAAALAFEEAYRRLPRGAALYNAGRSWDAAGDAGRAADDFETAIAAGDLDAHDGGVAQARLATLASGLAVIDVQAPASSGVSIDGVDRGNAPRKVHVTAGEHRVHVVRPDGSVVDRSLAVTVGASQSVTIEDAPAPIAPTSPAPVAPGLAPSTPSPDPAIPSVTPWTWIALGATGVFGVAGTVTYVLFSSDRSAFGASGDHDTSLHDRAAAERAATYVLWSTAGATAVTAAVLLLTAPHARPIRTVGVGPGWVTVSATF